MPRERLVTDPLRTLAYGTDASFYRLVPRIVAIVESESDVAGLLAACRAHGAPVTFRAAGTSLSGQAISGAPVGINLFSPIDDALKALALTPAG